MQLHAALTEFAYAKDHAATSRAWYASRLGAFVAWAEGRGILTPQHVAALMRACDRGETPEYVARDRAMLAVLLDTGLRASELCGLTFDRCIFTPDEAYLRLLGKGRKQCEVGLGKTARQLLHKYIHRHRGAPKGVPYVFVAKGGRALTA